MAQKLFIGGLPFSTSSERLREDLPRRGWSSRRRS